MSERLKYSKNGVYRCENFVQHLAQNTFPTVQLGTVGGINGWYIKMEVVENGTVVYPFIHCYDKPQLYIHSLFNILGKDGQSFFRYVNNWHLEETLGPTGLRMNILDILNEKNGYLDNGTLSIEYGFHIDGILGDYSRWSFNFINKLFNPDHSMTIEYMDPNGRRLKTLYCHKQLLCFHSPLFQDEVTKFQTGGYEKLLIEKCLQAAHGVRVPFFRNVLEIASIAHDNNSRNVVQYADQQLVVIWSPKITLNIPMNLFGICMKFGLRHYMAHLVDYFKCLEDLKNVIQKLNIQKMSGEAMKTFMAKIFKLSA